MNNPNVGGDLLDDESWTVLPSGYWVESGIEDGFYSTSPHFFWADDTPSGGFNSHEGDAAGVNTSYSIASSYAGSNRWLLFSGNLSGTSVGNGSPATALETGVEATNTTDQTRGTSSSLAFYPLTGMVRSGWTSSSSGHAVAFVTSGAPGGASIGSPYTTANWNYNSCPPGAELAAAPPLAPSLSSNAGALLGSDTATQAAATLASKFGDTGATTMSTVQTTRGKAVEVQGGEIAGQGDAGPYADADVYVTQRVGKFVADAASVPPGAAAPTGRYLTVVVNAHTGTVTDWGLTNTAADLASLAHG